MAVLIGVRRIEILGVLLALSGSVFGQGGAPASTTATKPIPPLSAEDRAELQRQQRVADEERAKHIKAIEDQQRDGTSARLKDISHFMGVRTNHLQAISVVVGLAGTGDSNKIGSTNQTLANVLKQEGFDADPTTLQSKNIALVVVTAELPPFAMNGQRIDVTVSTLGDATSLQNGTLMYSELKAPASKSTIVYATAGGQVSVGGYSAGGGGASQQKGFVTVGRIPGGGVVQSAAPTAVVDELGHMFLELDEPDFTTAHRVQEKIASTFPQFAPLATDGGTIQLTLPKGMTSTDAIAKLEGIYVETDNSSSVVINERTGTIVMGGNIKLAPVAIANGSISVKIGTDYLVSQPAPFSNGSTVVQPVTNVKVIEPEAQIAMVPPNTTVADLALIFQALKLKPADIIAIVQSLRTQGALKARVVIQ